MFKRFRRLRLNDTLRNLVQETTISKDDLKLFQNKKTKKKSKFHKMFGPKKK
jgi:porphobilinogen synthase